MRPNPPSLIILAAGMGSRYGGLKQLDSFGPNGETIIDYSIYDAINAGFKKIVFIVRDSFRNEIEARMKTHWGKLADLHFVSQELHVLPAGYQSPEGRTKPWGTGHAVWVARDLVQEPFGVINSDDYYGKEALHSLYHYLTEHSDYDREYAVIAYLLKNTLSENGSVNRGICISDGDGFLTTVEECKGIHRSTDGRILMEKTDREFEPDTAVSMNMWAFGPSYFNHAESAFRAFLDQSMDDASSEFYIPNLVQDLIDRKEVRVKVIKSPSQWFGVTYQEDRPLVQAALSQLIRDGKYPASLF